MRLTVFLCIGIYSTVPVPVPYCTGLGSQQIWLSHRIQNRLSARADRQMTSRKQWVCVADTRPLGAPRAVQPRGDEVRRQSGAPRVKILRLLHPRTNKLMPFMMVADHICELQFLEPPTDDETLTDGLSSWFVNDSVISDGRLVMASYVDPLFLALPHLMRNATRYSPLSQVLAHPSAVHTFACLCK